MKRLPFNINVMSLIYLNFIIWLFVSFLYSIRLSDILSEGSVGLIYLTGFLIPFIFFLGFYFSHIFFQKKILISTSKSLFVDFHNLQLRTKQLTFFFIVFVLIEFIYCGYIPLISMINGANISHFDFGVKSLHGLAMSLGALLFTSWFFIYYIQKRKSALFWMLCILLFFALTVTRKMLVVSFLQSAMLIFFLRKKNMVSLKFIVLSILVLVIFGLIGDVRTGRDLFLSLSKFNVKYPDWLPTGFGWFYIYLTTPIANFVNAIEMSTIHSYNFSFLQGLFPSFIRDLFFEIDKNTFDNDWQISGAFNVSTGFIGIYQSFGILGCIIFNFFSGFIYNILISKSFTFKYFLMSIIFSNLTVLMLFSNNFFNLNTVSQLVFAYMFFNNFKIN